MFGLKKVNEEINETLLDSVKTSLTELTDEECMEITSEMLTRVGIHTEFIQNEDELITHQVLVLKSGTIYITSDPQPLEFPLRLATMKECGITVEVN